MNPPLPSEISAFEPPSPSEFPVTFREGGMDIFWNHTILLTNAFANNLFSSKGMCEQVIMNEEIENEKAIKHRKKLIGRYSIDR